MLPLLVRDSVLDLHDKVHPEQAGKPHSDILEPFGLELIQPGLRDYFLNFVSFFPVMHKSPKKVIITFYTIVVGMSSGIYEQIMICQGLNTNINLVSCCRFRLLRSYDSSFGQIYLFWHSLWYILRNLFSLGLSLFQLLSDGFLNVRRSESWRTWI